MQATHHFQTFKSWATRVLKSGNKMNSKRVAFKRRIRVPSEFDDFKNVPVTVPQFVPKICFTTFNWKVWPSAAACQQRPKLCHVHRLPALRCTSNFASFAYKTAGIVIDGSSSHRASRFEWRPSSPCSIPINAVVSTYRR